MNLKTTGTGLLLLTILPPVALLVYMFLFHIDAPSADQWEMVPLFQRSFEGTLSIEDFWRQHNEHRIFFPRLIMIFLGRLTDWTLIYEILASFIAACCIFLTLAKLFENRLAPWFLPVLSLMIFSLSQSEAWLNSWNLQIYMNVLAACGMFLFLSHPFGIVRTMFAFLLFGVAFLSYANGIVLWPLGLLLLIPWFRVNRKHGIIAFSLWFAAGAILLWFYLHNYFKPLQHPSITSVLAQPFQFANYIFAYLGAPLFAFTRKAQEIQQWSHIHGFPVPSFFFEGIEALPIIAGLAVFIWFCRIAFVSFRSKNQTRENLAIISIGLYAFGTAVLSALGRTGFGDFSALSLRYIPISNLFWIPLLANNSYLLHSCNTKRKIIASAFFLFFVCNSIYGALYGIKQHTLLMPAQKELKTMKDDALLQRLYPEPDKVRSYGAILKKYNLNVFKQ